MFWIWMKRAFYVTFCVWMVAAFGSWFWPAARIYHPLVVDWVAPFPMTLGFILFARWACSPINSVWPRRR